MFKLSRGAEYAIRGLLHLAIKPSGEISYLDEISKAQDVPKPYLAKIFQYLSRKGFLKSYRGPSGGFTLLKSPEDITLLDIIVAMEGPIHLNDCLIHKGYCRRDDMCPVHDVWRMAQKQFLDFLASWSLADLVKPGDGKRYPSGLSPGAGRE